MAEAADYDFDNADDDLAIDEEEEAAKAFRARWVGVANATSKTFRIEAHAEANVPTSTTGRTKCLTNAKEMHLNRIQF